ncbi:ATP-dependent Clp protease adaptor ClpS [Marinoscillum sp. MHG1-6]|uniref:ATP-dependent Clp protease adaptor ClpS n=1 Tax=Marinoscillum sp. MHG1-6 TaxID=2959627 RepID=UPI002157DDB9|nr:ATP-dependent Clp protease adaptor ClpS [Marinoscillum sp. MHG1-6]
MEFDYEIEELVEVLEDQDSDEFKDLVVHNDDFNTFEHVTNTLIKVCKHDVHQAEQCTYIVHYKGRCSVKKGPFNKLKPMKDGITDAGIKATIE